MRNKSTAFNFTNPALIRLKNTTGKEENYRDTGQKGLIVRVTPAGRKIFRMKAWDKNKKKHVQMVIGHYPETHIQDARSLVAERIRDMLHGVDVIDRQRAAREEETFDDVFKIWIKDFAKDSKLTWEEDERRYENYIKDHLGGLQLSEITPDRIRRWRTVLTKQKKKKNRGSGYISKTTINRAFSIVSTVFSKCAPHMINPCSSVPKYKEKSRDVFMKTDDLKKFFNALNSINTPQYLSDYLLLSLYTGARRSNILSMKWNQVDLSIKIFAIPGDESKNKEPLIIPLIDQAVEILERRKRVTKSIFVFPGKGSTGHLVEPRKGWKALLKRAGIDQYYRLHDLRRTMGSWQAISGSSTQIIGASLGHKSDQATQVYARLTIDPIRKSMERAAAEMDKAKTAPDKVVKIKTGHNNG